MQSLSMAAAKCALVLQRIILPWRTIKLESQGLFPVQNISHSPDQNLYPLPLGGPIHLLFALIIA